MRIFWTCFQMSAFLTIFLGRPMQGIAYSLRYSRRFTLLAGNSLPSGRWENINRFNRRFSAQSPTEPKPQDTALHPAPVDAAPRSGPPNYARVAAMLNNLKQSVSLSSVVERYVPLRRAGDSFLGVCSVYDDGKPSVSNNSYQLILLSSNNNVPLS